MSHELEIVNGKARMFYNNRNGTPWHALGTPVPELATSAVALQAAGLDTHVDLRPVFLGDGSPVPGHMATVRVEDNKPLGIVGDRYEVLQNHEAFAWADDMLGAGAKFESAGSLFGGRRVWVLAKLPGTIEVIGGDVTQIYLLIVNSHDGSLCLGAHIVAVRVVCWNTLNAALRKTFRSFTIRHTRGIHVAMGEAERALGLARRYGELFAEEMRTLAQRMVTLDMTRAYVDKLIPLPEKQGRGLTLAVDARNTVHQLIDYGRGTEIPGVKGTVWGLYNGATEYADHHMAGRGEMLRRAENRAISTTIGGSRTAFKDRALELARAFV